MEQMGVIAGVKDTLANISNILSTGKAKFASLGVVCGG
jgi:hypothetical protein